jgi:exonuclease I
MKNFLIMFVAAVMVANAQDSKVPAKAPAPVVEVAKKATLEQQIQILKGQLEAVKAENSRLAKLVTFLTSEKTPQESASQATIDRVQQELGCRLDVNFNCIEEPKK